jgi:hypothetical protein
MYLSRLLAIAILVAASSQSMAEGMVFERVALSGQPKAVWTYRNWNHLCQETGGVTKVVSRPQHGRLSNKRISSPIFNRNNPSDRCAGKSTGGLQVIYTSNPGYRGTDKFMIEKTWKGGGVLVYTFIMTVR